MPVQSQGFAFRYFDKILCAVVGLGLLVGIGYGLARNAAFAERVNPEEIARDLTELRRRQDESPPAADEPRLGEEVLGALRRVESPRPVRDTMLPPLPYVYSEQRVPPEESFELRFDSPLAPGSVLVEGNEFALDILDHPVDGDYRRVRVASKRWEERASVVGMDGDVKHIHPVVIDSEVGRPPYPPVEVRIAERREAVRLEFEPDPRVAQEEVAIRNYEVWRRDWSDPVGDYALVAAVAPAARAEPDTLRRQPGVPTDLPPGVPEEVLREMRRRQQPVRQPVRPQPQEAEPDEDDLVVSWMDRDVEPGRRYAYKVRTVGHNTFPTAGEFTDPLTAEILPNIDFRFTMPGVDGVRVEVARQTEDGRTLTERFWVAVGDEIGGVRRDRRTGDVQDFTTGYTLVDFHARATVPGTGVPSSRIIYADRDGVLRERYRNETRIEEFWATRSR